MILTRFTKTTLVFATVTSTMLSNAFANDFNEDLLYFKNALINARFSDSKLEEYKNPLTGVQDFRLNEKRAPWAGNYFPMEDGGIAQKWQEGPKLFTDISNKKTSEQIKALSYEEISKLSATEKYDLMMNDYSFSATEHELKNRGPLRELKPENWEGFCNGIRAAGILLPEPERPIEVRNADGILIQFSIADLKALAGASYFYVEKYAQMGAPTQDATQKGTHQPNAAAFDIALRYFVGLKQKAFIIDSHLGDEIWNESVIGYKRKVTEVPMSEDEKVQRPWAAKKYSVDLQVEVLGEIDIKASDSPTKAKVSSGTQSGHIQTGYDLFVDASGKLQDGNWKKPAYGTRGIDFAWFAGGKGTDSHYTDGSTGNPWLHFGSIKKLFRTSSKPPTCKAVFSLL